MAVSLHAKGFRKHLELWRIIIVLRLNKDCDAGSKKCIFFSKKFLIIVLNHLSNCKNSSNNSNINSFFIFSITQLINNDYFLNEKSNPFNKTKIYRDLKELPQLILQYYSELRSNKQYNLRHISTPKTFLADIILTI